MYEEYKQQDINVPIQENNANEVFPEIPEEEAAVVFPSTSEKKDLSNIERYHSLQSSFNAMFDSTIKDYLVNTCHYPNVDKIDNLRSTLNTKFIRNSKGKTVKGEEKVIKAYLKSLLGVFECLYKEIKEKYFIPNPALLYKRIDHLIDEIGSGNVKKITKKEKENLCHSVIDKITGGLLKKKTRKSRKSRKARKTMKRRR